MRERLYATGRSVLLLLFMVLALGGCGQSGPLTLPVAEPPAAGEESSPGSETQENEEEENETASE
ncbi:MAG: lipoprotein [Candidatus Rariloculaceae bacterium]